MCVSVIASSRTAAESASAIHHGSGVTNFMLFWENSPTRVRRVDQANTRKRLSAPQIWLDLSWQACYEIRTNRENRASGRRPGPVFGESTEGAGRRI